MLTLHGEVDEVTECEFEVACMNAGTAKCSVCLNVAKATKTMHGYEHYPAFKDRVWYAKTLPYMKLKPLFEEVIDCGI